MRRIIITATALTVLAAAAVAYAQTTSNTYTASFVFHEKGTGTRKKPVGVGFSEKLTAATATAGMRAAPLTDIKTTLTDMKVDLKGWPTCSAAKIIAAKNDTVCPKGALLASGGITAELGDNTLQGQGTPCQPLLDAWNAGGGKVNFFFVVSGTHQCGGLQTGATAPFTGTLVQSGSDVILDIPLPADVSTEAANIPGTYGSLTLETLNWPERSIKVRGKRVDWLQSTGCVQGSRPVSVAFTATDAAGETLTGSASARDSC